MSTGLKYVLEALHDAHLGLERLINDPEKHRAIVQAGELLVTSLKAGGRVFSCGNGGSMCDAMHFAEELTGRYRADRPAIAATAIADSSHISCVGNDYGYEFIFSRYIEAHGRTGDVLLAISTSGTSKNVIKAVETAKARGMKIISLTGKEECYLGSLSNVHIATPAGSWADRVQELHIKVIHILIDLVERGVAS